MPLDANLDYSYFMKNRDRLLKLIQFLRDNLEVTDENVASRAIQEKITRNELGLRNTYSVSAMACLPQFLATSGGVQHFRTASLEMIAGHRALALYIIHYLKDVPEVPAKCPFFKCSLVTANKLYRRIFKLREDEKVSKGESRAMQHVLQSKNYYNDYFDLKQRPADPSWSEEDFSTRVQEFIQHQITFDQKKEEKRSKRTGYETDDTDEQAQGQEEYHNAAFRQPTGAVNRIPEQAPVKEESAPTDRSRRTSSPPVADHARGEGGGTQVQEKDDYGALRQPKNAVDETPALEGGTPDATDHVLENVGAQRQEEDHVALCQLAGAVDQELAPAIEEERTLGELPQRAGRSPSANRARDVQKEGSLSIDAQCRGRKALDNLEDASCTVQILRRSTRKIIAPKKLNL